MTSAKRNRTAEGRPVFLFPITLVLISERRVVKYYWLRFFATLRMTPLRWASSSPALHAIVLISLVAGTLPVQVVLAENPPAQVAAPEVHLEPAFLALLLLAVFQVLNLGHDSSKLRDKG
jgi:hypothetical protein